MLIKNSLFAFALLFSIATTPLKLQAIKITNQDNNKTYIYSPCAPRHLGKWLCDTGQIIKGWFTNWNDISALSASSPFVIEEVLKQIKGTKILELGAGTGPITVEALQMLEVLERLNCYYAIECVEAHHAILQSKIDLVKKGWNAGCGYPTFNGITNKDTIYAEHAYFGKGWKPKITIPNEKFSTILSTLPVTRINIKNLRGILEAIVENIEDGGTFLWVSLNHAEEIGGWRAQCTGHAKEYWTRILLIEAFLAKYFTPVEKTWRANISTMLVFHATRNNVPFEKEKLD